jgi:hypothetical protein
MIFEETQVKVASMIRARVYEIQWGGSVMPYVRYFESEEAIQDIRNETGYKVEVLL